jgi:hypothetical protein
MLTEVSAAEKEELLKILAGLPEPIPGKLKDVPL